ncbi:TetR/AcrR family transcriptional regulator [Erysipelothrix sp. HDW6C]|uniref:TetR/AcrR family transcriptional regulator n=1 Tax=Erysipelothrix sp. HDW6C TaxID=2714930 RepID=UPI00140DCF00|nr:TetR/AcrR family transcriptional regulator [Erysipelothrix sp. HDW6C]QIK69423.1 TetR/AcrR family transcriptional regulator [Erysipelothrix sp. HDW6C]
MDLSPKRDLQRQRTVRYFIDAAKHIATSEGINRITIRNVAELAGYNSATLYNYFENLDQLIAISMVDSITEYLHRLTAITALDLDSLTTFLLAWRCYAECSFANPEIYAYIFDSNHSDYVLSQIDAYFSVYAPESGLYDNVSPSVAAGQNLKNRDALLISPCIDDGYFKESEKTYIMEFCYVVHKGISKRIVSNHYTDASQAVSMFLNYVTEFLNNHLQGDSEIINPQTILAMNY